jgi:ribonuclease P protein component
MLAKKFRFSPQNFSPSATTVFSGKILRVKCFPNYLGRNRYATVIAAGKVKKAVSRNRLKRKILSRAVNLPNTESDILFIVLSEPDSKRELDGEFDKIKTALSRLSK